MASLRLINPRQHSCNPITISPLPSALTDFVSRSPTLKELEIGILIDASTYYAFLKNAHIPHLRRLGIQYTPLVLNNPLLPHPIYQILKYSHLQILDVNILERDAHDAEIADLFSRLKELRVSDNPWKWPYWPPSSLYTPFPFHLLTRVEKLTVRDMEYLPSNVDRGWAGNIKELELLFTPQVDLLIVSRTIQLQLEVCPNIETLTAVFFCTNFVHIIHLWKHILEVYLFSRPTELRTLTLYVEVMHRDPDASLYSTSSADSIELFKIVPSLEKFDVILRPWWVVGGNDHDEYPEYLWRGKYEVADRRRGQKTIAAYEWESSLVEVRSSSKTKWLKTVPANSGRYRNEVNRKVFRITI